jgi:hypothetical protein
MSGESKKSTTTQTEPRMWRRTDRRAYPVLSAVVTGDRLCVTTKNGKEFIVNVRDVDEAVH